MGDERGKRRGGYSELIWVLRERMAQGLKVRLTSKTSKLSRSDYWVGKEKTDPKQYLGEKARRDTKSHRPFTTRLNLPQVC